MLVNGIVLLASFFASLANAQTTLVGAQQQLVKNTLYGTINVPQDYSLSFSIKPTSVISGWGSIIHFSAGGDCCNAGDRMPALWFWPNSLTPLLVFGNTAGPNWFPTVSDPLPLNQWTDIKLVAVGKRLQYIVNGVVVHDYQIPGTRYTGAAKVYISDPWYTPAAALIKNVQFGAVAALEPKPLALPRRFTVNNYYGQINVPVDYSLTFTLNPASTVANWGSIIHLTRDDGNCCAFGQRMPGIWFHPGGLGLHVRVGDTTDGNWGFDTDPIPLNQETTVRLVGIGKQTSLFFNNTLMYSFTQPGTRPFGLAHFYIGDPWHSAPNAIIKNVELLDLTPVTGRLLLISRENSNSLTFFQKVLAANPNLIVDNWTVGPTTTINLNTMLYWPSGAPKYSMLVFGDGEVGYLNAQNIWVSAFTPAHWQQIADYETAYKVKRVMFETWPNVDKYGTTFFSPSTESILMPTDQFVQGIAGINMDAFKIYAQSQTLNSTNYSFKTFNGTGLYAYKAYLDTASGVIAKPILFADAIDTTTSVVGVFTQLRGTSQMIFHLPCADWSVSCYSLASLWTSWLSAEVTPANSINCVQKCNGQPLTSIGSTDGEVVLSCTLVKSPEKDVVVFGTGSGLKFSNLVTYPAGSVGPLDLGVRAISSSTKYLATIAFATSNGPSVTQYSWNANTFIEPRQFYLWGDPHFLSLNGIYHHFQGVGTWYLLKSDELVIQASYYGCNPYVFVTCINAVAIQYGSASIVYNLAFKTSPSTSELFKLKSVGQVRGMSYTVIGSLVRVKLEDDTVIDIPVYGPRMDLYITLSPRYYQKVKGQANFWDNSNGNGKLLAANGQYMDPSSVQEWGQTWAVPESEKLINGALLNLTTKYMQGSSSGGAEIVPYNKCDYTNTNCVTLRKRSELNTTSTLNETLNCPTGFAPKAQKMCSLVLNDVYACGGIIPDVLVTLITGCSKDTRDMCSYVFIDDYKQSFMSACAKQIIALNETATNETTAFYNQVFLENRIGTNYSCGSNGFPTETGCKCKDKWTGIDCSTQLVDIVPINTFVDHDGVPVDTKSFRTVEYFGVQLSSASGLFTGLWLLVLAIL